MKMDRLLTKTLADIYFQQGHFEKAYEIYNTLSEKNPSDPEIQGRLQELREKLGIYAQQRRERQIRALEGWLSTIRERRKGD